MSTTADLTAENKARALAYLEAIEAHADGRIEDLEEYVAADVVNHDPVSGDEVEPGRERGLEAFRRHAESVTAAFPDLRFDVRDVIAEDDRVMVRLVLTGTHDGPSMGYEPTGEEVTFSTIVVYRFEDGKIVERWSESNALGFLQQIGAVPAN